MASPSRPELEFAYVQFLHRLNSWESFWSASDYVNDCKDNDPDHVDEMPIEAQHVHTFGMFFFDQTGDGERHYNRQCQQSNNNVRRVQSDERVESGAKEVGLDGESFVVNQVLPLPARSKKEISSQGNRHEPPDAEALGCTSSQGTQSQGNGGAARQETDAVQNRPFEDLPRSGAAEILARVIQIGHDEDGEDGALRHDQASHANNPFGCNRAGLLAHCNCLPAGG